MKYFPLRTLIRKLSVTGTFPFCVSKHGTWALVLQRPGVDKEIKEASKYVFCDALLGSLDSWDCPRNSKRYAAVERLKQKWGIKEATEVYVWDISSLFKIDTLVSFGFDPSRISRDFLWGKLSYCIGWSEEDGPPDFNFWTKSAVEKLAGVGFPINCESIPIIDDESL